jgi:hypothetical protein
MPLNGRLTPSFRASRMPATWGRLSRLCGYLHVRRDHRFHHDSSEFSRSAHKMLAEVISSSRGCSALTAFRIRLVGCRSGYQLRFVCAGTFPGNLLMASASVTPVLSVSRRRYVRNGFKPPIPKEFKPRDNRQDLFGRWQKHLHDLRPLARQRSILPLLRPSPTPCSGRR